MAPAAYIYIFLFPFPFYSSAVVLPAPIMAFALFLKTSQHPYQPSDRRAVPFPLSPSSVSVCPALTLPLDVLLFSFSLHGKSFPPSLPLFPIMGGVVETNATGCWLYWLDEEAMSLCEKFSPFPLPSAQRGLCYMVLRHLQANGRLWSSAASLGYCQWGFRSGKSATRRVP